MTDEYRNTLRDVEIAKVGKTPDDREITLTDLEQVINNFAPVAARSGDHDGWDCGRVVALRVSGDRLLADLRVDDETADAIRYELLDSCSVHLVHDRQGARVDHVALLDCRRKPAVAGLPGLRTYMRDDRRQETHRYDASELHAIRGIEIFRAGKWNGDDYGIADLDDIVSNFGKCGFRPPVKLGHDTGGGDRAFGWVCNLRRDGEKLLADFEDIPSSIFKVIKERGYDAVSSEIFWDLERGDTKLSRVLKAVALLGSETPAVADLAPLRTVVHTGRHAGVHIHEFREESIPMNKEMAGAELLRQAHAYCFAHPTAGIGITEAIRRVRALPENAALCHAYDGAVPFVTPGRAVPAQQRHHAAQQSPDTEIDAKARAYIAAHPGTSYASAVQAALQSDAALLHRYAGGRS